MTPSAFRRAIADYAGRAVPPWALDVVVECFEQWGMIRPDAIEQGAKLAQRIALGSERSGLALPLTPGLLLDSGRLTETIRPQVEQVRREVFGTTAAPFRSLGMAARWIEETARRQPRASLRDRKQAKALEAEVLERLPRLGRLLRCWIRSFSYEVLGVPYAKPGAEWVHRVSAVPGSPLARLAEAARDLAGATGFSPVAIVAFILVGLEPLLPPARLTAHHVFPGAAAKVWVPPRRWVTVDFLGRDLTFGQLRQLHRRIREGVGAVGRKRVTPAHQALLELVRQLGGEPQHGPRGSKRAFWEKVRAEWNQKHPERRYQTWRGPEMAYRRLSRKLPEVVGGS